MLISHIPLVSRLRSASVSVLPLVGQPLPLPFSNTFRRFFFYSESTGDLSLQCSPVSPKGVCNMDLDLPQYSPVTAGAAQHTAYSRQLNPSVTVGAEPLGKVGMAVGMLSVWPGGTQL